MAAGARPLMFQEAVFAHGKCRLSEGHPDDSARGGTASAIWNKKRAQKGNKNERTPLCGPLSFHGVGVTATNTVNKHFQASGKEEVDLRLPSVFSYLRRFVCVQSVEKKTFKKIQKEQLWTWHPANVVTLRVTSSLTTLLDCKIVIGPARQIVQLSSHWHWPPPVIIAVASSRCTFFFVLQVQDLGRDF